MSRESDVDALIEPPDSNRREKLAEAATLREVGASSPGGAPERIEMTGSF